MSYPENYDPCNELELVESIDYTEIMDRLDTMEVNICACSEAHSDETNDKLDIIDSGLRQILSNLGDEINENEVLITNADKTMTVLI